MTTRAKKEAVAAPKVPSAVREAYLVWLRATAKMRKAEVQVLRKEIKAVFRQEKEPASAKAPAEQKPNGKVAP